MTQAKLAYPRVLLKVGGESLCGEGNSGIDTEDLHWLAAEIAGVHKLGAAIGIVIGGGNIFRGTAMSAKGMDRVTADHMGMLGTIINALALQDALESHDIPTRLLTAIEMRQVAEPYIRRRAMRHLEKKRVVIFAGGTGNPYFSTDTAAALRAMEIRADALIKATKVDGIYDSDPRRDSKARKVKRMSYIDFLKNDIRVMDKTAISLCMENHLPVVVFDLKTKGNIRKVVEGRSVGSVVDDGPAAPSD